MDFVKNTTDSAREGIKTTNGTLVWLEVVSCTIASILVLAFFFAPYRRWHTNPVLKLLFWVAGTPVGTMLSTTLSIMQATGYHNELHLVWVVFLVIASGSLATTFSYSLYISSKERMTLEGILFLNNLFGASLIISSFTGDSKFKRPLWVLWCLIMVKSIQRIIGFQVANRRYGTENVNLVANYMCYEHELTPNRNEVDPANMNGYKYLVAGEDKVKTERQVPDYLQRIDVTDKEVITIEKVWWCQGRLRCFGGDLGGHLKDVCLSFALFKLLRRRFFNYSAAEAADTKTHDFVFRGLLSEDDHRRAFRVIKVELEFLYDLFYTMFPISFSCWFSIFCVLQISTITTSVWTAVRVLHNYQTPKNDIDRVVDGKNVDAIISYVFVILIMTMEAWEFCNYLLSDWAKVMLICNYVKNPEQFFRPDKVVGIICRGKLCRPLSDMIGQYSLLENFRCNNCNIPCNVTCGLTADKKRKRVIKLPEEVKKEIYDSLRREGGLSNGELSLPRNYVSAELFWACGLPSHAHRIMVWHIATSHFEMIDSPKRSNAVPRNVDHQKDTERHRKVATTLSRYCAYLLVFAPELLLIVSETRKSFERFEDMRTGDSRKTMIEMGAKLAKQLEMHLEDEERRWRVLAEFWADLILFLAPSDNALAHAKKLVTGGEFIIHLWALLYHAGIERPQSSQDHTFTAFSV
uniref:Uncharacterized protein LOC105034708 n=1 Tax=Elaeis guineensis var. tenera TaxID=51953 RepID=A0A8N4EUF3_ELAGV|nr:uncharacterized protein LOC105034708 [Elaeis guineensis]